MAKIPKSVKRALARELEKDVVDYDRVIQLSYDLALEDEDSVRFSVDASHIDRLGRELVAKKETAVAELVKNAYDADATRVDLIFREADYPLGSLEIIDNGHGMTKQELIDGFMRISTQDKVDNPVSRKYRRRRAGKKGIGRFAAQRLGLRLTITTQTRRSKEALRVTVDWSAYKGHRDLTAVSNHIETVEKTIPSGTALEILDMRDAWTDPQIKRSFRYVSELLQPFPLSRRRKPLSGDTPLDPGFEPHFMRETDDGLVTVSDDQTTYFDHALAVVEGLVDSTGRGFWSLNSKRLDEYVKKQRIGPDRRNESAVYDRLRNVRFTAYYFVAIEEYVPKVLISTIRETLRVHGGIRLYRNGFRVSPYGEQFDDWLSLNEAYRRRHVLIPLATNNWLGFAEVTDPEGEDFEETASREGLLETTAFEELRDFLFKSLVAAATRANEIRDVKIKTGPTRVRIEDPRSEAEDIAADIEGVISRVSSGSGNASEVVEATQKLADRVKTLGETLGDQLSEQQLLRVLAGVGTTIGEFTHEIRTIMGGLKIQVDLLATELEGEEDLQPLSEELSRRLDILHSYALYFHGVFQDNVSRDLEAIDLRDIVNEFKSIIETAAPKRDIEIRTEINGFDIYTCPMHRSEWASILLNLYTNSIKAINREGSDGCLQLEVGEDGDLVYLEFSDNGDGIPEKDEEKIFDAFFSTTIPPSPDAPEAEDFTGMGLGLKIVRDIVTGYDGEIFLTDPPKGFATCLRIEVPRASEEEIPDDAY